MEKVNARTQALTRPMTWGEMPAFTAQNAQKKGNVIRMMEKMLGAAKRSEILRRSVKKYGIGIAAARIEAQDRVSVISAAMPETSATTAN